MYIKFRKISITFREEKNVRRIKGKIMTYYFSDRARRNFFVGKITFAQCNFQNKSIFKIK